MAAPKINDYDARYSIQREHCGYATPRWVVRFCGTWIDSRETEQQAKQLASAHNKERMANYATNKHPETGIAYGYIAADKLHPETVEILQHGGQARDLHYEAAKLDHLDEKRREWEDGQNDPSEFDENRAMEKFSEDWEDDEPVHAGLYEGVQYQTSWLGGALNVWIFHSPVIVRTRECSPCVPGAGDLNTVTDAGMETYGVPTDWLYHEQG